MICSSRTKKKSALFVLCGLNHLAWFQGLKYIPPSFWPQVTNHCVKSKSWKSYFLGHCSFTQLFHDAEKLRRKQKKIMKVMQRFLYVQHKRLILRNSTRSSQSFKLDKIIWCWQNLGMLRFSRFWDWIFATTTSHT